MKKNLILSTVVLALSLIPSVLKAQIGRNDWSYGLVIQTDNLVYSGLGATLTTLPANIATSSEDRDAMEKVGNFYMKNKWWIPEFRYRANVVQDMEFANGKASLYPKVWGLSHWDWSMRNYAIGYRVGYLSRVAPIGFDVQADYVQDGYELQMEGSDEKQEIVKRMLSATALLKIRLMKYDRHRINPVIELGGSYNYAFHYHDDVINDKDAVNNGFTGIIGLGFHNTETHISWSLRYEHSFYDFYNKDYMYNGNAIFAGSKSKFGKLGVAISYGF